MIATRLLLKLMSMLVFLYVLGQGQIIRAGEAPCPEVDVYQRAEQFHGDACAGQLIGVRLGLSGKEALAKLGAVGKMKAQFYNRGCAVDGIQVAAGTTIGTNTLEIIDKNEHRLVMSDKNRAHVVEIKLTKKAQEKSRISLGLKKKLKSVPDESEQMKQLKNEQDTIFSWFRHASDAEVVTVRQLRK